MLIAAAVGGVAALLGAASYLGGDERAIVRDAERRPEVAARDLRAGARVKLVGRVIQLAAPLEAPLSLRPCVAYRVRLHGSTDATGAYAAEERTSDFWVCDAAGGLVAVHTRGARLIATPDLELRVDGRRATDARAAAFLARHRARAKHHRYVLEEGVLAAGDLVTIVGCARRQLDPAETVIRSLREPPTKMVFEATDADALYVIAARRPPA